MSLPSPGGFSFPDYTHQNMGLLATASARWSEAQSAVAALQHARRNGELAVVAAAVSEAMYFPYAAAAAAAAASLQAAGYPTVYSRSSPTSYLQARIPLGGPPYPPLLPGCIAPDVYNSKQSAAAHKLSYLPSLLFSSEKDRL